MSNLPDERNPPGGAEQAVPAQTASQESQPSSAGPISTIKKLKLKFFGNRFFIIISWHFFTVGPTFVTAVLLGLNISGYIIGTEIGKDQKSTDVILGVIQVASKVHEVIIVVGLINIVQQQIHRSFQGKGALLGLLGAEKSLGGFFFVLSTEFRAAFSYGFSKSNPERQRIRVLVAVMLVVCILCTVVGPASALLMIPELGWFFEDKQQWIRNSGSQPVRSLCYPYILIDPRLGGGEYTPSLVNLEPIPEYWQHSMYLKRHHDAGRFGKDYTHITHQFPDIGILTVVNSTTSWDRPLEVHSSWKGGTKFTTVPILDRFYISASLIEYQPVPKNAGSEVRFIADTTGIETETICRRRAKLPCINGNNTGNNSSDWCYMFVTKDSGEGPLQRSQDLLLLADHSWGVEDTTRRLPRFWITEGLRSGIDNRFTNSIVFVFEDDTRQTSQPLLTVCSTSTTLGSVTAISSNKLFTAEKVQAYNHLDYFKPNKNTAAYMPPRTLLYHENWLDMIHQGAIVPGGTKEPLPESINKTYAARAERKPTENAFLKALAIMILNAKAFTGGSIWANLDTPEAPHGDIPNDTEAGMLEILVGGPYITMLSRMMPSYTQYSMPIDKYNYSSLFDSITPVVPHYPAELMPEATIDCTYIYKPVKIYRRIYGYRSTSISSILSMVVLIIHSCVAILGSIRQCLSRAITKTWDTIPEYGTLWHGTDHERGEIENICAEIKSKKTLGTLVGIRLATTSGTDGPGKSYLKVMPDGAQAAVTGTGTRSGN